MGTPMPLSGGEKLAIVGGFGAAAAVGLGLYLASQKASAPTLLLLVDGSEDPISVVGSSILSLAVANGTQGNPCVPYLGQAGCCEPPPPVGQGLCGAEPAGPQVPFGPNGSVTLQVAVGPPGPWYLFVADIATGELSNCVEVTIEPTPT